MPVEMERIAALYQFVPELITDHGDEILHTHELCSSETRRCCLLGTFSTIGGAQVTWRYEYPRTLVCIRTNTLIVFHGFRPSHEHRRTVMCEPRAGCRGAADSRSEPAAHPVIAPRQIIVGGSFADTERVETRDPAPRRMGPALQLKRRRGGDRVNALCRESCYGPR